MPAATKLPICAAVLLAGVALLETGAAAQAQLGFEPATVAMDAGDTRLVEVRVTGVESPGLSAFQVTLSYNPVVATLADPNAGFTASVEPYAPLGGDPLCATVRGTPGCDDPVWLLTSTSRIAQRGIVDDDTPGVTTIVFGTTGSAGAPIGDGALLMLEVNAVANGSTSVALEAVAASAATPPSSIPIAIGNLTISVGPVVDGDGDGVADGLDNCLVVANADQRDSNNDGYGNICDPDLNNDGIINAIDLGLFKTVFFTSDDDADFDGNGIVNVLDLGILKTFFFLPPGPSGIAP